MKSSLIVVLALAVYMLTPVPTSAQVRVIQDDSWCDDQFRGDDPTYCEVRELTLPRPSGTLSVDAAPNGGIEVVASQRADILVQARVMARGETDAEAETLAGQIEIRTDSDRIEADGPGRSSSRSKGWWVSYRLSVPVDLDLRLRSRDGGLTVTGLQAELDLRTTNGGIHLEDVGGDVRGRTTNGGLHVRLNGDRWSGARFEPGDDQRGRRPGDSGRLFGSAGDGHGQRRMGHRLSSGSTGPHRTPPHGRPGRWWSADPCRDDERRCEHRPALTDRAAPRLIQVHTRAVCCAGRPKLSAKARHSLSTSLISSPPDSRRRPRGCRQRTPGPLGCSAHPPAR